MKKDQIQGMEKEKRQQMIKEGRNGMEYNKIQRMEKGRGIDRQIDRQIDSEKMVCGKVMQVYTVKKYS